MQTTGIDDETEIIDVRAAGTTGHGLDDETEIVNTRSQPAPDEETEIVHSLPQPTLDDETEIADVRPTPGSTSGLSDDTEIVNLRPQPLTAGDDTEMVDVRAVRSPRQLGNESKIVDARSRTAFVAEPATVAAPPQQRTAATEHNPQPTTDSDLARERESLQTTAPTWEPPRRPRSPERAAATARTRAPGTEMWLAIVALLLAVIVGLLLYIAFSDSPSADTPVGESIVQTE